MACVCQWNYITIPAKGDVPEHKAWSRVSYCTGCMIVRRNEDSLAEAEDAAKKEKK